MQRETVVPVFCSSFEWSEFELLGRFLAYLSGPFPFFWVSFFLLGHVFSCFRFPFGLIRSWLFFFYLSFFCLNTRTPLGYGLITKTLTTWLYIISIIIFCNFHIRQIDLNSPHIHTRHNKCELVNESSWYGQPVICYDGHVIFSLIRVYES